MSLDEHDNDLNLFLSYFLAAVQTISPGFGRDIQILLGGADLPPMSALIRSLINELDGIEQDFVLVLDDFHFIRERSANDLLAELLRHPPRPLHLVLIGRKDPFLPISALRARNQVTKFRMQDLGFTVEETAAYLQQVQTGSNDASAAALWTEKTEGWVAGLRLAALSMRKRKAHRIILKLPQRFQYVAEYLFNEVLSNQHQGIRHCLLRTSILSRFTAPLCDAVCGAGLDSARGNTDSWKFIRALQKENLFIINLDAENRWFRYHHMFQQLLQTQLERHCNPQEIAALHERASRWFAENGLIEEAIRHALAGNDSGYALHLLSCHRTDLINHEQWHRMDRWFRMFVDTAIEEHPQVVILKLWQSVFQQPPSVEALNTLQQAEARLNQTPLEPAAVSQLQGEIDYLRCHLYIGLANWGQSQKYAHRVLDELPAENFSLHGNAHTVLSVGYYMAGESDRAFQHIDRQLTGDSPHPEKYRSRLIPALCYFHWWSANTTGLPRLATHVSKLGRKFDMPGSVAVAAFFLGCYCYSRNELATAEKHLASVVENHFGTEIVFIQNSFILALTYLAQGRADRARKLADSIYDLAIEKANSQMLSLVQAFQADLALQQGLIADAGHWADRYAPYPIDHVHRFYVPQLTLAKVLLARNTPESRKQAAELLDRLHDFVLSIHNTRVRIDVLALQAMLYDARGEEIAALDKLTESLTLSEPGGFIRNFVNMGPPMAGLLDRLKKRKIAVDHIGKVLAAFRPDEKKTPPGSADDQITTAVSAGRQPLIEPLTNRELDVLELLAQRLQNKEIADKLFVSAQTVKGHLKNIYQKLEVGNRREAVIKARDLAILPDP